jgi:hypothetical protein
MILVRKRINSFTSDASAKDDKISMTHRRVADAAWFQSAMHITVGLMCQALLAHSESLEVCP